MCQTAAEIHVVADLSAVVDQHVNAAAVQVVRGLVDRIHVDLGADAVVRLVQRRSGRFDPLDRFLGGQCADIVAGHFHHQHVDADDLAGHFAPVRRDQVAARCQAFVGVQDDVDRRRAVGGQVEVAPPVGADGGVEFVIHGQSADPGDAGQVQCRVRAGGGDGCDPGVVGDVGEQFQPASGQFRFGGSAGDEVELHQDVDALPVGAGQTAQGGDVYRSGPELAGLEVDGVGGGDGLRGWRRGGGLCIRAGEGFVFDGWGWGIGQDGSRRRGHGDGAEYGGSE